MPFAFYKFYKKSLIIKILDKQIKLLYSLKVKYI